MTVLIPLIIALLLALGPPVVEANEPIRPIPREIAYDLAKAALGRRLFSDPLLSLDQSVSCASCHDLAGGGHDSRPVSLGIHGRAGRISSPTVFNAVFNFRLFWNGRAENLAQQAAGPLQDPVEMGISPEELEDRLNRQQYYADAFKEIYDQPRVRFADLLDALAEFQRALITPDSPFDLYLRAEAPLQPRELRGYRIFKEFGCITCHNGINLGGNSFQKIGVINRVERHPHTADRAEVTGDPRDHHVFKVPTLRNIALTAPYFHNASSPTLPEALKYMAHHNLGVELRPEQITELHAFLLTLTGQRPMILQATEPGS